MMVERNEAILQAHETGETYTSIGRRVGLTRQRVHQVIVKAQAVRRNKAFVADAS